MKKAVRELKISRFSLVSWGFAWVFVLEGDAPSLTLSSHRERINLTILPLLVHGCQWMSVEMGRFRRRRSMAETMRKSEDLNMPNAGSGIMTKRRGQVQPVSGNSMEECQIASSRVCVVAFDRLAGPESWS